MTTQFFSEDRRVKNSSGRKVTRLAKQKYLDGEREEVDLLEGLDLAVLHQAAKLGHRDPFLSSHVSVEN